MVLPPEWVTLICPEMPTVKRGAADEGEVLVAAQKIVGVDQLQADEIDRALAVPASKSEITSRVATAMPLSERLVK